MVDPLAARVIQCATVSDMNMNINETDTARIQTDRQRVRLDILNVASNIHRDASGDSLDADQVLATARRLADFVEDHETASVQ